IAPHFDSVSKHRLIYLSNSTGSFIYRFLTSPLDSIALDFDIASNGIDRLGIVWNTLLLRPYSPFPKVSYAELSPNGSQPWSLSTLITNLNQQIPPGYSYWKNGMHLALQGDRVVISGLRMVTSSTSVQQVGFFVRSSLRPR